MKRKLSILAFILGLQGVTHSQVSNSECDKYREIIENNISELKMDDFGRSMIVGKNDEYINSGLSKHFTSEPKIPNYIYTAENLNMKMVDIIIAHVDLYHCDLEELKRASPKDFNIAPLPNDDTRFKVFPNPTYGMINIEGDIDNIEQILLFNSNGNILRRISKIKNSIDLTGMANKTFYLYFISKNKIQSEKVIKF